MLSALLVTAVAVLSVASSAVGASALTPGKLRGVVENSGVCETTSGVYQASGYGDISTDGSVWFWFFEARNNPDTAPLTVWLQGEGGTSSMVGLLTENGPCRLNDDQKTVTLNMYSFNQVSNVLYIDQPIGVGFSYGSRNTSDTQTAASDVWQFLQIFFADSRFAKYQKNDFGLWSEHYGGTLVSTFATNFLDQNDAIDAGTIPGVKINVKNIGIGGPYMDPLLQLPYYLDYAVGNPYTQLVSASAILKQDRLWYATDNSGIQLKVQNCYANDTNNRLICWDAGLAADENFIAPLSGSYSPLHVNSNASDLSTTTYLTNPAITSKIGATSSTYTENNIDVAYNFKSTGSWIRNSRPLLEGLINKNILVGMWSGDADFVGNYMMTEALASDLNTNATFDFYFTQWSPYKVGGQTVGQFKQLPPFSYVRFTGAGHNLGNFGTETLGRGEAALAFFNQTIHGQTIA
ncbi:serine carboxypeptidase [Lentinus tigrinus ALCF2SS1-7]|uniref:serine carboxypeptidase n=1 Tax=Lentinus tigrinus ALCF2SS1-7 TaxID=1328758 RepID=UPI001165E6A7|nr:serine carboxypeptidase [Lentinus tigrinus ALCF2SS1-7]